MTAGYDTILRTQLVIHVGEKQLRVICKDGRILNFSHEPQELRDFILCQIAQHQVLKLLFFLYFWLLLYLIIVSHYCILLFISRIKLLLNFHNIKSVFEKRKQHFCTNWVIIIVIIFLCILKALTIFILIVFFWLY